MARPLPEHLSTRRLVRDRLVVFALAVGKEARMAKVTFFIALDTMDRFPMSTATRLLFLWIRHELVRSILLLGRGKKRDKITEGRKTERLVISVVRGGKPMVEEES
jgi:hypothetical protein